MALLIRSLFVFFALLSPGSKASDWNYFGACKSDDVILAVDGKWYSPCFGRGNSCPNEWVFSGSYKTLPNGNIEVSERGSKGTSEYTHRKFIDTKCR
jgi:hypothetical protein